MSRGYRHIEEYEEEILRLRREGKSRKEIGETLGFTKEQIKGYINRRNRRQRKIEAGITIKKKGRPCKEESKVPPSIQQLSKLTQLQYEIARKDAKIKSLEMENELMRDFLSLTGKE